MGFWKTFFGRDVNPEGDKMEAVERNFNLLKFDGVKAMRLGQVEYAEKCFVKALEAKDDPEVRDYLSRAYIRLGRLDEALAEIKKVAAVEPDNVALLMQAASVAYIKEDYSEMTALCEQALKVDANSALAHLYYAKAELAQGHHVQGIARLTKAIALDEELVDSRLLRGQTLFQMGKAAEASEDAEWLMEHSPNNEDGILLKARITAVLEGPEAGIQFYDVLIDHNPFCAEAFRERGHLRLELGDKQGAEEDMKMVLELNPQEMADVNGNFSAEGIEHKTRQAYSNLNPFGL